MKNKFLKIILILLAVLILEVLFFCFSANSEYKKIDNEHETNIRLLQLNHEQEKKELNDEFEANKYLAGGKDAYERIYNSREKDIVDLLEKLSAEALPLSWKSEIKTEEFTNFILVIQNPIHSAEFEANEVGKYLIPILNYSKEYLKNIAVYNDKHQSYLYFNEDALNELLKNKILSNKTVINIKSNGKNFIKYNAIKIDYGDQLGHILINDAIISGNSNSAIVTMLFDTGASITTISSKLAQQTGMENLNLINKESFSTANGVVSCPIVEREIIIAGLNKKIQVAACPQTDISLLGVNFFESLNYLIDADSKSIYVWSK